jgi:hypothetical protein
MRNGAAEQADVPAPATTLGRSISGPSLNVPVFVSRVISPDLVATPRFQ